MSNSTSENTTSTTFSSSKFCFVFNPYKSIWYIASKPDSKKSISILNPNTSTYQSNISFTHKNIYPKFILDNSTTSKTNITEVSTSLGMFWFDFFE